MRLFQRVNRCMERRRTKALHGCKPYCVVYGCRKLDCRKKGTLLKRVWKWGSHVFTVIIGLLMVITMYCSISSRINGGTPTLAGMKMYEVLSGSMEPSIQVGALIFDTQHVQPQSLKVGDVITFQVPHANGLIVTHRIVSVAKQNGQWVFQTKGDANPTKDNWQIPASDVIGQYTNFTIPYVGYYLNFLKTKMGVSLLMILPGALLIILALTSMFREIMRLQKGGTGNIKESKSRQSNINV